MACLLNLIHQVPHSHSCSELVRVMACNRTTMSTRAVLWKAMLDRSSKMAQSGAADAHAKLLSTILYETFVPVFREI